jgi:UDPglucose 6-dehydrogenase
VRKELRVGVIGTGYVGLVTGACFSDLGHHVVCVDSDPRRIASLRSGDVPIYEPRLAELVLANSERGSLAFTTNIGDAVALGVDVLFVAVGTPASANGGGANLDYVFTAVEQAARALAECQKRWMRFTVFVIKSTVPVGTSRQVASIIGKHLPSTSYAVASNPEFLREGNAVDDFMKPDRIIFGSASDKACRILEQLYLPLTRKGVPLVVTAAVETAELTKYAANAFLAMKISFTNELARLCELAGANIQEVALGVGLDGRIGPKFLSPGPGFGGSCFPKDLRALIKTAKDFGSSLQIVEAVLLANQLHKEAMVEKVRDALDGRLRSRRIAVLGIAFKAGTDDTRDAPSLTIIPQLIAAGAEVTGFDPAAGRKARELLPGTRCASTIAEAVDGADAVVILTEWPEFRTADWATLGASMRRPLMVDLRNINNPDEMAKCGFDYVSLGRPASETAFRAAAE